MEHKTVFCIYLMLAINVLFGQDASIKEQTKVLKTYPFSDPNPIPILLDNPKIYPYFKYEGYSHESYQQDWKIVTLENDYIKVFVAPEVGGKVWGAIEKSSGEEFIYRNEVMKFRNISMRGPWTSGGIEFNFGIIGHHPSTATPVDYVLQEHEDGSVSCTVGNIDLPSRTQWRVTVKLPKDKAAFETNAVWYNPTSMNQSYYNWMTAAAPARSDFEFFTPGDELLKHSGQALPWPIDDEGRNLALYKENNFGPSKSYHIVGEYNDFFGGYYHNANYGFGHWGEYESIPGQKLWLWALSRSGGIWEDLLTDSDGQYIEFQAGRQFLQYSPGEHLNPQTQANFEPYSIDQWKEVWFPVKDLGGLTDVSENAVMHIQETDGKIEVKLHSFTSASAKLQILQESEIIEEIPCNVTPMEVFSHSFSLNANEAYTIRVPELNLHYTSNPSDLLIDRPFHSDTEDQIETNEHLYRSGLEDMKFRLYADAKEKFDSVIQSELYHIPALIGMAELLYRQAKYDEGLQYANQALILDTYHPGANYIAAILYRAKANYLNAKEAFGWAARSMAFRSNAYCQISEILLAEDELEKANQYARKALAFNDYNIQAWSVIAIVARKLRDTNTAENALSKIESIDPINHFVKFERHLLIQTQESLIAFQQSHRSELSYQSYLELAIDYYHKHQIQEAITILNQAPDHPLISIWKAFLEKDDQQQNLNDITSQSAEFVFPFRRESLGALEWLSQHESHWKLDYYYSLNLWAKDRKQEAAKLLQSIHSDVPFAPFYVTRAHLLNELYGQDPLRDLKTAHKLEPQSWRTWKALIQYYIEAEKWDEGLTLAQKANTAFPENYSLAMDLAKLLNQHKKYNESIELLAHIHVLPFEGASEGRRLYESAHYWRALELIKDDNLDEAVEILRQSKLWPETLGVGKPYDPDERIPNYLLGYCESKQHNHTSAKQSWKEVIHYSNMHKSMLSPALLLGLLAEQKTSGAAAANKSLQLLQDKHGDQAIIEWLSAQFLNNTNQSRQEIDNIDHRYTELIQEIAMLDSY